MPHYDSLADIDWARETLQEAEYYLSLGEPRLAAATVRNYGYETNRQLFREGDREGMRRLQALMKILRLGPETLHSPPELPPDPERDESDIRQMEAFAAEAGRQGDPELFRFAWLTGGRQLGQRLREDGNEAGLERLRAIVGRLGLDPDEELPQPAASPRL